MASRYNQLQRDKARYCKGKINKDVVKATASKYVQERMKKGESKKQAQAKANKVLRRACGRPAYIQGRKKNK